jgi:EAL and modified HD-GYP domain-containing signal transduction protein
MSLMDTLLGTPMSEILTTIPVSEEVKDALNAREGVLGRLLNLVESLEKADMAELEERLKACTRITLHDLSAAQIEALKWSNSIAQSNE